MLKCTYISRYIYLFLVIPLTCLIKVVWNVHIFTITKHIGELYDISYTDLSYNAIVIIVALNCSMCITTNEDYGEIDQLNIE